MYNRSRLVDYVTPVLLDSSGNLITGAAGPGTVYCCGIIKTPSDKLDPSFPGVWPYLADATAQNNDMIDGMTVIDLSATGDNAYAITASGSSERLWTTAEIGAKFLPDFTSLASNLQVSTKKYYGPCYNNSLE